jgi:hypothetical protein
VPTEIPGVGTICTKQRGEIMPSVFGYSRPRGIRGNYIVAIVLDLADTETATVNVARQRDTNCGYCGVQTPRIERKNVNPARTMTETGERRWELYRIDQIVVGDKITLQVQDRDCVPHQETIFIAYADIHNTSHITVSTVDGFLAHEQEYRMNNINFGVIKLNPIQLIDWEKQETGTYPTSAKPNEFNRLKQVTAMAAEQKPKKPELARVWKLLNEKPQPQHAEASNGHQHR